MATEELYIDEDGNPVSPEELGAYDVVDVREFDSGSTWDAIKSIPLRGVARASDYISGGLQAVGDLFGSETLTGLAEKGRQNTREFENALNTATNFEPGGVNENISQIGGTILSRAPALLVGGPLGAASVMGGMSGADKYGQFREQGVEPGVAADYSALAGIKDTALSLAMLNPAFKPGMNMLEAAVRGAAYGVPSGAVGGGLDEAINQAALDQSTDLERIKGAAKYGGITGGATGAFFGAVTPTGAKPTQSLQVDDLLRGMDQLDQRVAPQLEQPTLPAIDQPPSTVVDQPALPLTEQPPLAQETIPPPPLQVEPPKPIQLETTQQKTVPDSPLAPAPELVKPPVESAATPIVEAAKKEVGVIDAAKKLLTSDPEAGFFTPGDLIDGAKGLRDKIFSKVSTGAELDKMFDEMGLTKSDKPGQDITPKMSEAERLLDSKAFGAFNRAALFPRTVAKKDPLFMPIYKAATEIHSTTFRTANRLNEPLKPYLSLDDARRSKVDAFAEANRKRAYEGKPVFKSPEEMRVLGFDDEQIAAFQGLRKGMDLALDIYGGALKNRLANLPEGEGKLKAFAEIDSLIRSLRDKEYIPFGRFGDKFLRVLDDTNNTEAYFMFENDAQAKQYKKALLARGSKVEEGRLRQSGSEEFSGIPFNLLLDVSEKLRDVSPGVYDEFQKIIGDMVNLKSKQVKPQSGFSTRFRRAELVPGYSKDFRRVISDYAVGLAHFDAHSKWSPEMQSALTKIPENSAVREYATKYISDLKKPDPETVRAFQKLAATYYLSRPSSAATNLSQSFLTTLPEIYNQLGKSGKGGTLLSSRILANSGGKALNFFRKGSVSDPALSAALNDEIKSGLLSEQAYRELTRQAEGTTSADLTAKLTTLFRKAETFNRTTAFISGWEVGKRKGLQGDALKEYASEFVNTTQFDQTKANRPMMAKGWTAPAFTFRLFSGHFLRYLRDGMDDGNWRRLVASPLAGLLIGGLVGVPFAAAVNKVAENFGFDPRGKLKKNSKDGVLEGIAYGGVPHVLGLANLSGSLGTGDILPDISSNPVAATAQSVLGVPYSMVGKLGKAYDQFSRGYPLRGAAQLLPEIIKGPVESLDAGLRGKFISGDGTVLVDKPTPYELGLRSLGGMPPRLADAYVDNRSKYLIQKDIEEQKGNYNWEIAKAMVDGGDITELYQKAIESGSKPNMAAIRSYMNKMSSAAGADMEFVKKLPKTRRAEAMKRLED